MMFFQLTRNWNQLMKSWSDIELVFLKDIYKLPTQYWSLRKKLLWLTVTFLLAALLEHILFFTSSLTSFLYKAKKCAVSPDLYFEAYVSDQLSHLFEIVPYNLPIVWILEFFNFSFTFYWNNLDLIIMLISISLAHRFQQINERIEFFRERVLSVKCMYL